jgi:multidrug resistance efflux pump
VAVLADARQWYVRTSDLTELEVVDISVGQEVEVVPDALPGLKLKGIVEEISNTSTTKSGDILYEVKIRLEDVDPQLRWGMTVETTFLPK